MDQPPSRQMAAQLETLHPETVLFEEFSLLPPPSCCAPLGGSPAVSFMKTILVAVFEL